MRVNKRGARARVIGATLPACASMELPPYLTFVHPAYAASEHEWRLNERRLRGGLRVLDELQRLETEADASMALPATLRPPTAPGGGSLPGLPLIGTSLTGPASTPYERALYEVTALSRALRSAGSYAARLAQAVYVNYPARMAWSFVGALMRQAPDVGTGTTFGTLGDATQPTSRAADVYTSTSAPRRGQHWDAFWAEVMQYAMATGHRWVVRDAPAWDVPEGEAREEARAQARLPTQRDEQQGFRPYLRHVSPLAVPDWHLDEAGRLLYLRLVQTERVYTRGAGGKLESRIATRHLLYTRRGFALFDGERGEAFEQGGWWLYDEEGRLIRQGQYADEEIPALICYYERAAAAPGIAEVSRPGLTEIGQCAISAMNLDSIADHDAKVSGQRRVWAVGADPTGRQHQSVVDQLDAGSRYVSVPGVQGVSTTLHDSGAVSGASSITLRHEAKQKIAKEIASDEATFAPDASGESKKAEYREGKSPRLALMAFELETAQTAAIHLLERGYQPTVTPTGKADWPKDFDLEPLVADVKEAFELLAESTATSEDLTVTLIMAYLQQKGLIAGLTPAEQDTIEQQLRGSLAAAAQAAERGRELQRTLLGDATDPKKDDSDGDEGE